MLFLVKKVFQTLNFETKENNLDNIADKEKKHKTVLSSFHNINQMSL